MVLQELKGALAADHKTGNQSSGNTSYTLKDYKSRLSTYDKGIAQNKEMILDDLLHHAKKLLTKDPYYYPVYKLIADILVTMGKENEAIKLFDDAISRNLDVADLYYFKGQVLEELGKTDEARRNYINAIDDDSSFLQAYYSFLSTYIHDKKGELKDINKIKEKEFISILNQARDEFNTSIFKDSRSINYSKAVPYFFDQIYFY